MPSTDTNVALLSASALQGLVDAAPDAVVVADAHGAVVIANRLTERMFGYARDELLGKPVVELVPERYRASPVLDRSRFTAEPRIPGELTGRRKDGSEFPVEISLSPVRTDDGLLVTAAIRDITDRKQVEARLRASLLEKEVLLKEIHHRVKNNLQIVSSMLNLQIEQISDPRSLELFKESQNRVRSIALFHEQLYQSRDLARVDIAEYLKRIATGLFATYGANPDEISLRVLAEDVPLSVDAAIACGLIVNELVSNALKHAFPRGTKGQVTVTLQRAGGAVVLEVRDDGTGLPGPFDVRAAGTLGLKLVALLSEQLRGELETTTGTGTATGTAVRIRFVPSGQP